MLTKKKLRKWLNISALVFVVATMVVGWIFAKLPVESKLVGTIAMLAALRASVPSIKKEAQDAIDGADLPEDEPAQEPPK